MTKIYYGMNKCTQVDIVNIVFKHYSHILVYAPILTIDYDFCLNKTLICCLLIVIKVVVKFGEGV